MRIRIDENGKILAYGQDDEITGDDTYAVPTVPSDFIETFSVGKYIAPGGIIEEVMDWVAPEIIQDI